VTTAGPASAPPPGGAPAAPVALQLTPFAVPDEPRSGGELRVTALADGLRGAGVEVARAAVVMRPRDRRGPLDLSLPWTARVAVRWLRSPPGLGDLRRAWWCAGATAPVRRLAALGPPRVDLLLAEHPWVYPLARRLRDEGPWRAARLVYSSHNVEWALREQVWRLGGTPAAVAARGVEAIRALEAEAARGADLCLAVSEEDAAALRGLGARRVAVVPNAVDPVVAAPLAPPYDRLGPYVVLAASAHLPNLHGFTAFLGEALDWVPEGARVVVVGSAGPALRRRPALERRHGGPDEPGGRWWATGPVPRPALHALLANARAVLLPIGEGGGTNLKTAEALLSGRPVVATPLSLRGFAPFADAPGLAVAADPAAFQAEARRRLLEVAQPTQRHPRAAELTWTHAQARLVEAVAALLPGRT